MYIKMESPTHPLSGETRDMPGQWIGDSSAPGAPAPGRPGVTDRRRQSVGTGTFLSAVYDQYSAKRFAGVDVEVGDRGLQGDRDFHIEGMGFEIDAGSEADSRIRSRRLIYVLAGQRLWGWKMFGHENILADANVLKSAGDIPVGEMLENLSDHAKISPGRAVI